MSESAGVVSKLTDGFLSLGESFIPSSYVTSFRELILDNENTIALQILVILVVWLLLNLCLIRSAWSIYSSDVHSILTAQGICILTLTLM